MSYSILSLLKFCIDQRTTFSTVLDSQLRVNTAVYCRSEVIVSQLYCKHLYDVVLQTLSSELSLLLLQKYLAISWCYFKVRPSPNGVSQKCQFTSVYFSEALLTFLPLLRQSVKKRITNTCYSTSFSLIFHLYSSQTISIYHCDKTKLTNRPVVNQPPSKVWYSFYKIFMQTELVCENNI